MREPPSIAAVRRWEITVRGVVQGVGFRPFIYNTARAHGLAGWVLNEADAVRIEVQGDRAAVDGFVRTIREAAPPQARIDAMEVREGPVDNAVSGGGQLQGFQIRTSEAVAIPQPTIPADLATCPDCLAEIRDPLQRRYRYPFTNCTNCGPRWSIIEQLPYDRLRTSMAAFVMCAACRAEYEEPGDRRFHAQPIACPNCGPTLQLLDGEGREQATGSAAIDVAAHAILAGQTIALKGLGGFQLLVDATNVTAVERLRKRKRRPDRPFAVMLPTLDAAKHYCHVSEEETAALCSAQAPIVLLRRREPMERQTTPALPCPGYASNIADGVAPGNPYLGVMLPYTPLHHLLMAALGRPLVCTSGNLSEEPMAITIDEARENLGTVADLFLTHNRPIVRPVDDSIVRIGPDGTQVLRRARGYAPLPIEVSIERPLISHPSPTILAVGGHLKNAVALALSGAKRPDSSDAEPSKAKVVMSAHIGDLDSVASVEVFRRAVEDATSFFDAVPDAVVCDLHPDYASTRHAEQLAARWDVPLVRVQHHHAHVAACMAEHGLQGPVLGFSWDGTGYGLDGTIWGGETLLCERGKFRRAAQLRTFGLPGGDRAMREPRRAALGLLFEMFGEQAAEYAGEWFSRGELDTLLSMLASGSHAPRTSSMGRLFDGVAAICGFSPVISFEGQAAMSLEFAAGDEQEAYPLTVRSRGDQPLLMDWEPMVHGVLRDRKAEVPVSVISSRFHNALARVTPRVARYVSPGVELPIVLTGGCFQNRRLLQEVRSCLLAAGFPVYTHQSVPPGDGGIALGQVAVALNRLKK